MAELIKNPIFLKRILEVLLVDDLKRRQKFDLTEVFKEMDIKNPEGVKKSNDENYDKKVTPQAARSTLALYEDEIDLTPEQMDFFNDGI